MRLVRLSRGKFAQVDDEDFDRVSRKKWSVRPGPRCKTVLYAVTNYKKDGQWRQIEMQRFIMRPPANMLVTFMNHDGLDCRKENLRVVDTKTAARHRRVRKDCSSGLKGVFEDRETGRWGARVTFNGQPDVIGLYDTPMEAAKAYDETVRSAFGVIAPVHFPKAGESSARMTPIEIPPPDRPRRKETLDEMIMQLQP